ncbi:MAG: molybdopterin molybdotransferase MoeA [Deltaproteobacteria bacterium]|nr:molybdopterin molybdotransferase MoeA [Deltaproteobacteria bacterium]
MITVEDARKTILSHIEPLAPEKMYILDALGRYLAEDVHSPIAIPQVNNSAMDGYAVRSDDIVNPETKLTVIYDLPAGTLPKGPVGSNQAVRIMTGAPVPPGADAVVMRENTEESAHEVIIKTIPKKHEHIRFMGEDIAEKALVLKKGALIGPAQIGVLASIMCSMVHCHQRPVVAVLGTGDEIVDLDQDLSEGKVVSSNSYTLISLIKTIGGIPLYLGIAKDNRQDLQEKFSRAKRADLILTSGGVSLGDYDLVKKIMTSGENRMEFWQVEMKPGKPLAFGNINGIPAIGLPGNPVSTMISFYQFARPAILKMLGADNLMLPCVKAKLKTPLKKKTDRAHYIRGILRTQGQELVVSSTGPQGSGILTSMADANCFIVLPKETSSAEVNELVECELFQMASILPEQ